MTATSRAAAVPREELEAIERLRSQIARVIVGQKYLVERLLIALLANNHVLLEGRFSPT